MFPAFSCANNIESVVNSLFELKIFNPFPSFTFSLSPSSAVIGDKSVDSSPLFVVLANSSFSNQRSLLYVSRNKLIGSYFYPNFNFLVSERAIH